MQPKVSILIPHFQTPTLTLLCLRLLRQKTRFDGYEVVVIDNGSTDGSGKLIENLRWVRLVRREVPANERPARSHGLALNFGIEQTEAPYVLIMHTDTMILRSDWLQYLVQTLERQGPDCGLVGSWKMESHGRLRRFGKWLEECARHWRGGKSRIRRYARSHCALYRRAAVRVRPNMFEPSEDRSAGEELHFAIEAAGMRCHFLPPHELGQFVRHLNHATMALNTEFGRCDPHMPRTRAKTIRRIQRFFRSIRAEELLVDRSLDR